MLREKRILLVVTGGIAAFKSLDLVRQIRSAGGKVRTILTQSASEFVTPLSLQALTEDKVYSDIFSLTDESEMGHIQLSRKADLIVVAPATANFMAKMRAGISDDLASTVVLATDKPIIVAPAMNVRMWDKAATQENLSVLKDRGFQFVGPNNGEMACGEYGLGRMSEPSEIIDAIQLALRPNRPLHGKSALVTAGPTWEPIDPVRFIANRSSGKQGYAFAEELAAAATEAVANGTGGGDSGGGEGEGGRRRHTHRHRSRGRQSKVEAEVSQGATYLATPTLAYPQPLQLL